MHQIRACIMACIKVLQTAASQLMQSGCKQADVKQEVEAVSYALVDAQAARDAALQKLAALANCAGPDACAAVGIDASVEGDDAIVRRHLERIAALEREVIPLQMSTSQCSTCRPAF